MKEKLEILMADTGLRVGEIATKLGVKAPVISHILSGRNQPNFTLTAKIISTFNQYNPYWWLGCSDVKLAIDPSTPPAKEGETNSLAEKVFHPDGATTSNPESQTDQPTLFESVDGRDCPSSINKLLTQNSQIDRVIVFYKDNTFESFAPRK
jgi:DNA-binding XRE family transcriptional regulator